MLDTRLHNRTQRQFVAELATNGLLALDSQVALMDLGISADGFERMARYEVKAFPEYVLMEDFE